MQEMQNTKKKVLISFVGNRDPYSDSRAMRLLKRLRGADPLSFEGSVLTVCRELKPDIVYLFPSSKDMAAKTKNPDNHTEGGANQASGIMAGWESGPECHIMPLMADNVADASKLYPCFRDNINKVMNELANRATDRENWQEEYEITFATSSGTQQMNQAAQLVLANAPFEAHYCRCSAPNFVKKGENRVFSIDPLPLEETTLLRRIDADVEGFYFHSVVDDCARLADMSIHRPRKVMAGIIRDVFSAYEKMEVMQYDEAFKIIAPLAKGYSEEKDGIRERQSYVPTERISAVLDEQRVFLGKLKGQGPDENAYNLVDLYFNMERAFTRGNYVDVLSRFWRLREGMMNFRLLANWCLDRRALSTLPDGKDKAEHDANLRVLQESQYKDKVDEKGRIKSEDGLKSLSDILCDLFQDFELKQFESKAHGKLNELRNVRNSTIVAHGMSPVKREDVEDCMTLGKGIVALIPGGMEICESYPFTLEKIREIVSLLKHV